MNKESQIKKVITGFSEIWVDEGILHVKIDPGAHLSLEDVKNSFKIYADLGFGPGKKKALQLLQGANFFNMSKEARDYTGRQGPDFFTAAAIISDSIALRMLINLFASINKHGVPFKMFSTEEDALIWLRKFKDNES